MKTYPDKVDGAAPERIGKRKNVPKSACDLNDAVDGTKRLSEEDVMTEYENYF